MILILLAAAAAQPQAETPRTFLERIYAKYPDFNPFAHLDRYFAPRLAAAIHEDSRLARGEVGYLDGDPICQCQDPEGMHATVVKIRKQGPDKAVADVSIGWEHDKPRPTKFSLVRTRAGWRIADVSSSEEPSFLRALEESNRQLRASQRHK